MIARRATFLGEYQDRAYAESYRLFVEKVRVREAEVSPGSAALTEAVAKNLFKLMAYKDEYEVARLYTGQAFRRQLADAFEGEDMRLTFHLAPPLMAKIDPSSGKPKKMTFGPWMMKAFGVLAGFKGLRGTAFDPFGYTAERRDERARIGQYRTRLEGLLAELDPAKLGIVVEIASLPERIRGYGHVRAKNAVEADAREEALLTRFHAPAASLSTAAE